MTAERAVMLVTYFKRNLAIRTVHVRRLRNGFCLSTVSLLRQQHDSLDFPLCLSSRVLHVTLANLQRFGFEFHLRSSPSAFSG